MIMGERVVACHPASTVLSLWTALRLEALERMAPVAAMDVSSLVVRRTQDDSAECGCVYLEPMDEGRMNVSLKVVHIESIYDLYR